MNTPRNTLDLDRLRRRRRREDVPSWMRERYDDPIVEGIILAVKVSAIVAVGWVLLVIGQSFWRIAHAPHDDAFTQQTIERCMERGGKPVRVLDAEKQVITVRCDGTEVR